MQLSVLIVNYNGAKYLSEAIDSLISAVSKKVDLEIIVQDNNSTDDSCSIIESLLVKYQNKIKIIFIKSNVNVGFAAAINDMVYKASFENIMILNNDTIVVKLDNCLDFIDDNDQDYIVAPKICNIDGSEQKSGFTYPSDIKLVLEFLGLKSLIKKILALKRNTVNDRIDDYFSGCVLFFKKSFFLKLNGFDAKFYFYHEECDFFMRSDRYRIIKKMFTEDQVFHYGGGGKLSDYAYVAYYTNLCRLYMAHGKLSPFLYKNIFILMVSFYRFLNNFINVSLSPFDSVYKNKNNSSRLKNRQKMKLIIDNIKGL